MKERIGLFIKHITSYRDTIGKPPIFPDYYHKAHPVEKARMERGLYRSQSIEFYNDSLRERVRVAFKDLSYVFPEIHKITNQEFDYLYAKDLQKLDEIINLLLTYHSKLPN